jgi:hypothetical protein
MRGGMAAYLGGGGEDVASRLIHGDKGCRANSPRQRQPLEGRRARSQPQIHGQGSVDAATTSLQWWGTDAGGVGLVSVQSGGGKVVEIYNGTQ